MKKYCLAVLVTLLLVCSGCGFGSDIPRGYVQKEEHFDEAGFQDYTDYAKYSYSDTSIIAGNKNFHKLTAADVQDIKEYFENFAKQMKAQGREKEYDFSLSCIDAEDYVYKQKASGFENYTILFFDTQSRVLYYIHNS